MTALRFLTVVVLASVLGAQATSNSHTTLRAALANLEGDWHGALTYVDYSSGKRVELPARWAVRPAASGEEWVTEVAYQDPGHEVRSLEVLSIDAESGDLLSHSFSDGEVHRDSMHLATAEREATDRWTLVFTSAGTDDRRPCEFRRTRRLADDRFVSTVEVRYADGNTDGEWFLRNELAVERVVADAKALIGSWQVDLRPTPDAPAYYATLAITEADASGLTGRFYDTEIADARVNVAWGVVHFAFTTRDGSGVYHTSGRLEDGRLVGTTHSLGRGFLSPWTAEKAPDEGR